MGHHIIIGGGFAGIAAAVQLAQAGKPVILLEKKKFLGGRAYSITDRDSGDRIDNGQHVLMGCYHETFNLLRTLGTEYTIERQPQLNVRYRGPDGFSDALDCPNWPGPLHLLGGLLRMKHLSLRDRWAALRFGNKVKKNNAIKLGETVTDFYQRTRQPDALRKLMWDPIQISALNLKPHLADMSVFAEVLRQAFFGKADDSCLAIPITPLQAMHGESVAMFIKERGGEVRTKTQAQSLEIEADTVKAVQLSNGERIPCETCISATSAPATRKLMQNSGLDKIIQIPELGASAIVSVYLWFDKPFSQDTLCCLMDSTFEWIFHRNNFMPEGEHKGYCVCLVLSAANDYLETPRQELIDKALQDVHTIYPDATNCTLMHSTLFWERHATFEITPAHHLLRPESITPLSNFWLAGDWTQTGLPATIEGAVQSGNRAADLALLSSQVELQ